MPRLPLGDLEEALKNPMAYRQKLQRTVSSFYRPSYFGALRDAVFKFHRTNGNLVQARKYLEGRLAQFSDVARSTEIMGQFEWYTEEYANRGWPAFETRLRLVVPLPSWAPQDLLCSGEVSRVDMVPAGGYAAWLMRSRGAQNWSRELRMPLIQGALACELLGVSGEEVRIGIICFEDRLVDLGSYSQREIAGAYSKLENLLRQMGF
jgi:hypothetical protein